jgi:hypothetical protein
MPFKLPEVLPTGAEELAALRGRAMEEVNTLRSQVEANETVNVEYLRSLVDALSTLDNALAALATDEQKAAEIRELLAQADGGDEDEEEAPADEDEEEAPADALAEERELVTAGAPAPRKRTKTTFAGGGSGSTPNLPARADATQPEFGWLMDPSMAEYKTGYVSFRDIAEAIDSVRPGARVRGGRPAAGYAPGGYNFQTLARLNRDVPLIEDSHALVDEIQRATDPSQMRKAEFNAEGSLTAAGGWCAPSEQLYDFCDVPLATDLISLPEITIRRGGVRWPVEPDLTEIFESFVFFFTEPQLEAVDGNGDPTAIKTCVEIPCPDEFEEIRLNAVGYCVEAGILQTQGWPELIEWFMRSLTQEHFRALSRRTILDMVAGSTAISIPETSQIAAGSSVLNSIELMAVNLRLNKGLARGAQIEGVAPNWLHAVIRADLANQQGVETKSVTDAQINSWFTARSISFQFVADWQTRSAGMPGNLATTTWPGTVQVMLYPAGTWFRALDNVIQFGILYPRELLQINRYTRFFTEDAYAVGKRCNESLVVTIPICPNGAYGEQQAIECPAPSNEVQTLTITGSPTGGTFTLTYSGQTTAAIAYNASAAVVEDALEALSNIASGDVVTGGGALPGTPVTITFTGNLAGQNVGALTANGSGLTGGTAPAATITETTPGGV